MADGDRHEIKGKRKRLAWSRAYGSDFIVRSTGIGKNFIILDIIIISG
jgi:hypothetical protein